MNMRIQSNNELSKVRCSRKRAYISNKKGGTSWTWGSNEYGQLGNGTTIDTTIPCCINNTINKKRVESITQGKTTLEFNASFNEKPRLILI